jgi:hypothetical protein
MARVLALKPGISDAVASNALRSIVSSLRSRWKLDQPPHGDNALVRPLKVRDGPTGVTYFVEPHVRC